MFTSSTKSKIHKKLLKFAENDQVESAIEYINTHLSDIDAVDEKGATPLVALLQGYKESFATQNRSFFSSGSMSRTSKLVIKDGSKSITFKGNEKFLLAMQARMASEFPEVPATYQIRSHAAIAKYLVEAGAKDQLSQAFSLAGKCGDIELMTLLLAKEVNVDQAFDYEALTALHRAVYADDLEMVEMLLPKVSLNIPDAFGRYPLHLAMSAEMVNLLVKYGADIQQICSEKSNCRYGDTPLHAAISNNRQDVVEGLLALGADPYKTDSKGKSAFAQSTRSIALLGCFLGVCGNVNFTDDRGNTLLHLLLSNSIGLDIEEQINFLLDHDADCTIANNRGETVLHLLGTTLASLDETTKKRVFEKCTQVLNAKNEKGQTILHLLAASRPHSSLVRQCLELGADPYLQDGNGNTMLHVLLMQNHIPEKFKEAFVPFTEELIKGMPDLDVGNAEGNTIAHYLCRRGLLTVVQEVAARGANLRAINAENQTPLFFALAAGEINVLDFLLSQNCNLEDVKAYRAEMGNEELHVTTRLAVAQLKILFPEDQEEKQLSLHMILTVLQFTRWALDKKTQEENFAAYQETLNLLMSKFGEETFTLVCQKVFDEHLHSLDIRNISEYGAHTDIAPIESDYLKTAQYVIEDKYQLLKSMRQFGYLVNVRTLFGDVDFWRILRAEHVEIYKQLIAHIKAWPEYMSFKAYYCDGRRAVRPLLEVYFSEAFKFISADLEEDLKADVEMEPSVAPTPVVNVQPARTTTTFSVTDPLQMLNRFFQSLSFTRAQQNNPAPSSTKENGRKLN